MDISEIKQEKRKLEENLLQMFRDFHAKTGMTVSDVDIKFDEVMAYQSEKLAYQQRQVVYVSVDLEL